MVSTFVIASVVTADWSLSCASNLTICIDLAYLKDPPPGYLFPAVDIFGSLANIKDKLKGSLYASEYQFHVELYQVFSNTHDGHFIYYSDLLSKVFDWGRQFSLVSVSLEASELPKIYITSE